MLRFIEPSVRLLEVGLMETDLTIEALSKP